MFGTRRRQNGTYHAIGLDLGADAVKMLQLRTPRDGVTEVAAAARVPLQHVQGLSPALRQAATVKAIGEALRASPFVGRAVVTALPRQAVHLRTIRLAPPGPAAFDPLAAAEREAGSSFPFSLSSARVAYLPAGEVRHAGETRHEVIVAAASDGDVNDFLELMSRAGLRVAALDLEHAALCRAAERALAGAVGDEVRVLFEIGATASNLVMDRGGELCLLKMVPTGTRHIEDVVSRRLSVSVEDVRQLRARVAPAAVEGAATGDDAVRRALYDAMRLATSDLLEQLVLCLRYYTVSFRGRPATKVWLTGGGADGADLRQLAATAVGLPVDPLPLMAGVPLGPLVALDNTVSLGEWAVAYGLALREAPSSAFAATVAEVAHA